MTPDERKKFMECRNDVLRILKDNNLSREEAALVCASSLNECFAGHLWGFAVTQIPLVFDGRVPFSRSGLFFDALKKELDAASCTRP